MKKKCNECNGNVIEGDRGFYICVDCELEHDQIYDDREDPLYNDGDEIEQFQQHGEVIKYSVPHIALTSGDPVLTNEDIKISLIFNEIEIICNLLRVNDIFEDCCHLFKKINRQISFQKYHLTLEDVSATIVYLQCKLYGRSIFYKDFEKLGYNKRFMKIYYNEWIQKFNFKIRIPDIKMWIWRFLDFYIDDSKMQLKIKLYRNIDKICKKDKFWDLDLHILSISCFYVLMKKFNYIKISMRKIEKDFGISYISILNYTKKLKTV